jgi:hypothetical protein
MYLRKEGQSEVVNQRRADNTMAKRKLTTGQRIIYKTLHKNIGRILVFVDNFGIAL